MVPAEGCFLWLLCYRGGFIWSAVAANVLVWVLMLLQIIKCLMIIRHIVPAHFFPCQRHIQVFLLFFLYCGSRIVVHVDLQVDLRL